MTAVSLILGLSTAYAAVPRDHVSLNGAWQLARVKSLDQPPSNGWQEAKVPSVVSGWRYDRAWYRRTFEAPGQWQGRRVKLLLQGAKFCPVVYVNGRKAGEHFGGYEPCEFDITAAVRPGERNRLLLGVHDWTALFKGDPVVFPEGRMDWHTLRRFPKNRVMYPIGGRFTEFGLWDDVVAYAVLPIHVADAFVRTDVSRRELRVDYEISNEADTRSQVVLSARAVDGDRDLLSLGPKKVTVEPRKTATVTLTTSWSAGQVTLWSPEHPKLYTLVSRLESSVGDDQRRDRFGFRQLSIKGHDFYLNGVKRHLLASSSWPMRLGAREEVADALGRLKGANVICFRTHTQPWRQIWYDVADEIGLMMIPEGAVWNDDHTYSLDDPEFWHNWGGHLQGMVRALRNHASVVMWSLENEFFGRRASAGSEYEKCLADLGRLVKRADPTRPIYYESDGDPSGVADVIGLHYPNEPPGRRLWPDDAYWMDEPWPRGSGRMFWPTPEFLWDRAKPLYIGEYLWWPASMPASYTLIHGDQAYRDLGRYRHLAKAAVWRWQTVAYRHYEVSGICPWTLAEGGRLDLQQNPVMAAQAYAMQPLAAYLREETRRAYAGSRVSYHVEVFNDLPEPVNATLRWELVRRNAALVKDDVDLPLTPGDHQDRTIGFVAPTVEQPSECMLRITIRRGEQAAFSDEHPLTLYPQPRLRQPAGELFLFDRGGATEKLLSDQGAKVKRVERLADFEAAPGSVLIIGEEAIDADHPDDPWLRWTISQRLGKFVVAGGRVIVLRQTGYPKGVLPTRLDAEARSTMAFVQMPHHPLLEGLGDDAFKFWQRDHVVTAGELRRPSTGGSLPLVVTGHPDGISHCALLEARRGRGVYLMCQMPLVERFLVEPMAAELLDRLLRYAAAYKGEAGKVLLAGGDADYRQAVEEIGLRHSAVGGNASVLKTASLALIRGHAEMDIAGLLAWVRSGGKLLLDRPPADMVMAVGEAVGLRLRAAPYGGPPLRTEGSDALVEAVAREDLYWTGEPSPGPSWHKRPLASDVADGGLAFDADFKPVATFGPEDIEIKGHIVHRQADHIAMASAGTGRVRFTAPATGKYLIGIEARGTPCQGVFAAAAVAVDGRQIGMVYTLKKWQRILLPIEMEAGPHKVAVRFINDRQIQPEDRNFYLRGVTIGLEPGDLPRIVPIASGSSVAAVPMGKGRVVINFLRWDAEQRNALKARRFFASLLTAMGADFAELSGAFYDLTQFKPKPGLQHYHTDGGLTYMGTTGWVEGEIEAPETGQYRLVIEAAGTKAAGAYPEVALQLDRRKLGTIRLSAEGWRQYVVQTGIEAGKHVLRVRFTNDYHKPPEDRNLKLGRLIIVPVN